MMSRARFAIGAALGLTTLIAAIVLSRAVPHEDNARSKQAGEPALPEGAEDEAAQDPAEITVETAAADHSTIQGAGVESMPDDRTTMARLRSLMLEAPAISLELARDGNARFPGSVHAAERAWFETRALVLLGRFDEARRVANRMVQLYPDTDWTTDVRRHLLGRPAHPEP